MEANPEQEEKNIKEKGKPGKKEKQKEKGAGKKEKEKRDAGSSWIVEGEQPIDFTDPRYVQHVVCIHLSALSHHPPFFIPTFAILP